MGKGRHVVIHDVIHDVCGDTTKWETDQSAVRTWPCKYSMHQYSILLQILGNWLISAAKQQILRLGSKFCEPQKTVIPAK